MISYIALASLLTTSAFAASSSSGTSTSTANPLIPTGISTGCSTFLASLNADSDLKACTTSLIATTSAYGPGGSVGTASSAGISSTLSNLCSTSTTNTCPDSTIRTSLANFYAQCTSDLSSSKDVIAIYDALYSFLPLRTAACTKDDSGNWCALQTASAAANSSASSLSNALVADAQLNRRADTAAIKLNTTAFVENNIPFLFLSPTLDSSVLCTTCTRNVITAWINFESDVPYGPGISSSALLSGQSSLYAGVKTTCGDSFLSGAVQAAGGLSGSKVSAAVTSIGLDFTAAVGIVMGVVTVAFASIQ